MEQPEEQARSDDADRGDHERSEEELFAEARQRCDEQRLAGTEASSDRLKLEMKPARPFETSDGDARRDDDRERERDADRDAQRGRCERRQMEPRRGVLERPPAREKIGEHAPCYRERGIGARKAQRKAAIPGAKDDFGLAEGKRHARPAHDTFAMPHASRPAHWPWEKREGMPPPMHAAVVVFPGSNADAEMIRTLRDVVGLRTSIVWHRDSALPPGTDLVAIPGGFSYGDYLRCGAIAKTSPILADVRRHADRGGLVLGVCNGFQILTECGLLPGALTRNAHLRFECREIFLRPAARGPFTSALFDQGKLLLRLPIAHAEGRYQASAPVLATLSQPGETGPAVSFEYVDASGKRTEAANPNGSVLGIAGVYGGERRNVMGLMPHPERMSEELLGGADGRLLFEAAKRAIVGATDAAARAGTAS